MRRRFEEAVVTDADVFLPVDVLIGVVDVDESFVIDCVVEVAVLAVVVFAHGEATKWMQRENCIKHSDAPLNM